MARELVIKMGKALGMESQTRGWQGEQPLSSDRYVIFLKCAPGAEEGHTDGCFGLPGQDFQ